MRKFIDDWYNVVRPLCKSTSFVNLPDAAVLINEELNVHDYIDLTHSDQFKERYYSNRINRFKTMGRLKKYKKYRNFVVKGQFVQHSRTVDLSKQSLARIIRKEWNKPYSYWNALPLPINNVSRIIGVMSKPPRRSGYVPNYEPDFFVKDLLCKWSRSFSEFISSKSGMVLPGAWKFSFINLVDMCTPVDSIFSIDQMIAGLKSRRFLELHMPKVDYNVAGVLGLGVNPKANPGVNTSRLFGQTRRKSIPLTKGAAYALANRMVDGELVVDKSLVHIGGREKRILYDNKYKEVKTRITCGQEDVPTLIGQSLVTPLNKSLQILNKGFNWGGRINGRSNYKLLLEHMRITDKDSDLIVTNTDFIGHDNNAVEAKIVTAFAFLRCCFPVSKGIDNLFFYCLSGMVFKRLVLPESGLVYEVTKGVLTGHAFTSIITTVCAYITISTSINETHTSDEISRTKLQGAGDDWLLKVVYDKLHLLYESICSSGNKCDPLTDGAGKITSQYPDVFPTFLKKHYINGFIAWNVNELFTNLTYPTSTKMKLQTKIYDLMVMCVSGPFNNLIIDCCKRLIILHIISKFMIGRFGYTRKNTYYGIVFNEIYYALCFERSLDTIINKLPKSIKFSFMGELSGGTDEINLQYLCKMYIKELDVRVHKSRLWMVRPTLFPRHESVTRLKVFDINKVAIPSLLKHEASPLSLRMRL